MIKWEGDYLLLLMITKLFIWNHENIWVRNSWMLPHRKLFYLCSSLCHAYRYASIQNYKQLWQIIINVHFLCRAKSYLYKYKDRVGYQCGIWPIKGQLQTEAHALTSESWTTELINLKPVESNDRRDQRNANIYMFYFSFFRIIMDNNQCLWIWGPWHIRI